MFHFGNQGGPNLGPVGPKGSVSFENEKVERGPWGKYFFGEKSLMPYVFGDQPETHRKKRTRLSGEEQEEKYPNRPHGLWWSDEDAMEGPHTLRHGNNENGPVEPRLAGPYNQGQRRKFARLATRKPRLAQMTPDEQAEYFREKYPAHAHELQKREQRWFVRHEPLINVLSRSKGGGNTKKKGRSRGRSRRRQRSQ